MVGAEVPKIRGPLSEIVGAAACTQESHPIRCLHGSRIWLQDVDLQARGLLDVG